MAQAARALSPRPGIVVNLQGDEPLIEPGLIAEVAGALEHDEVVAALLLEADGGAQAAEAAADDGHAGAGRRCRAHDAHGATGAAGGAPTLAR